MAKKPKGEKVHTFTIKIRFDKRCNKRIALREVRDCIHGEFYCGGWGDDPETFKVARIGRLPKAP